MIQIINTTVNTIDKWLYNFSNFHLKILNILLNKFPVKTIF